MAKRDLILNIDTANEEIVRLDALLDAAPKAEAITKLEADIKAANDLLNGAPKPETVTKLEADLKAANEKNVKTEADLKEAQTKVDKANTASLQAAAAAGVHPVVDAKVDSLGNQSVTSGLTGLARAQAANAAAKAK